MDDGQVILPEGYILAYGGVLGSRVSFQVFRPKQLYVGLKGLRGTLLYSGYMATPALVPSGVIDFTPVEGEVHNQDAIYADTLWLILEEYVELLLWHNSRLELPLEGKQLGRMIAYDRAVLEQEILAAETEQIDYLMACYN